MQKLTLVLLTLTAFACQQIHQKKAVAKDGTSSFSQKKQIIVEAGKVLQERIQPPQGFSRTPSAEGEFITWLRNLPLHQANAAVKYFNGASKPNNGVYCAVVNLPIGKKDLHQCADAVMTLRANYLYDNKRYKEIQFKFLNDEKWHNYFAWCGGNVTDQNFSTYLEQVWSAANTRSLFWQMKSVNKEEMKVGDVLIVTGNPYGHAIMVVDECINTKTSKKLYLLAQSYMPAQETQILCNPANADGNPWYSFDNGVDIETPEWNFTVNNFRRF